MDERANVSVNLSQLLLQNIKIIDDFISPIEVDMCKSSMWEQSDYSWHSDSGGVKTYTVLESSFLSGVIHSRLTPFLSALYGRQLIPYAEPYVRVYPEESSLSYHIDSEGENAFGPVPLASYHDVYEKCVTLIEYAANIYLGNDFDGGELVFHKLGISVKPKPGQLIVFPAGAEYAHSVNRINSGERLTVVVFYTTPKLRGLHEKITQNQSV
jgi:predicted 2-oxoglutarate/Fe(II)-dependent dioxygenase YbiX